MSRTAIHHLFSCLAALSLPTVAGASAPDPVEQLDLDGRWSGEAIIDVGYGSVFRLHRSIHDGLALGFEIESEGARIERYGVGAVVGLADDVGVMIQLDADERGRPSEASALLIAETQRGPWSATGNLALRQGWRGEFAGYSLDYAWAMRAAVTRRVAVGVEGAGRIAASARRRGEDPSRHVFGMGVALVPRARGAAVPEFAISVLREARLAKSTVLLRASIQINFFARPPGAPRRQEAQ